ncbi:hypothetical protein [Cognatilysobacter lacus]|uniref:Secreted protein n=1 Tax=Cognatilysobacter lacus TaxID=1643323 RepID=A0A5D8YJI5_9GAMM|nr:hypothetical protein [Lysobacter lacus]TZF82925.1 hypothetical protein FW784_13175 [Lysobacter lacus]
MYVLIQWAVRTFAAGLCVGLMLLPRAAGAQSKPGEACYSGTCYPSLQQAEAVLQSDPQWNGKYQRSRTITSDASPVVTIEYTVPPQPPAKFYALVYSIQYATPCSAWSDSCLGEQAVIDEFMAGLRSAYSGCELRDGRWSNSFAEPFYYLWQRGSGTIGDVGGISFGDPTAPKRYEVNINCPQWGDPTYYQYQSWTLDKTQWFECPAGSTVISGYGPGHVPDGVSPDMQRPWPYFCFVSASRGLTYWPPRAASALGPCDGSCKVMAGD